MEIDKVDMAKEEPHFSGAYIRSLVKHLTSTNETIDGDRDPNKNGECFSDHNDNTQQPPSPPPQPQKQVRRRLHTSKPCQERLLNMADARREIATALKFHRASMKQQEAASNHDLQSHPPLEQEGKSKSRRNPRLYPSAATNNYLGPYSGLSFPPLVPYHRPISTLVPPLPPLHLESLNLALPNQTLGLNLNFQDFNNMDTKIYHNSSSSASSSAAISVAAEEVAVPNCLGAREGDVVAMEDETGEMRSLGEQHQMEWNDSVNLVTSARWCKLLKAMEIGPEDNGKAASHEDGEYHPFEQVMEFPPWLINPNESSCLQQLFDHHFSDEYLQDPGLPRMDIGEIEGMDGEWLA